MTSFECVIVEADNQKYQRGNKRISLAYAELSEIPNVILTQLADQIKFLDLSYNDFRNLSFLECFSGLQTLVLDRNFNLNCNTLPHMENLRILWLNNCNIINVLEWLQRLQVQCPNLKHLSMMCNPVGQTLLNGVTAADELKYRRQVIKLLPQLSHFDGVPISKLMRLKSNEPVSLTQEIFNETFRGKFRSVLRFPSSLRRNNCSIDSLNITLLSFDPKQVTSSN